MEELEKQLEELNKMMTPESIAELSDEDLKKLEELINRIKELMA